MFSISKENAIVIGASAGGISALKVVLSALSSTFPCPIFIVQHFPRDSKSILPKILAAECKIPVREGTDKMIIEKGCVYIAPPGYHLLVEADFTLALSLDELENWSRPSIDVLFESAAKVYRKNLVGVLLTGANSDGALGLKSIADRGGVTIVQDPDTAESRAMPNSGIQQAKVDYILSVEEIGSKIVEAISKKSHERTKASL